MKVDLFDFNLPEELIAERPLKNRDDSRMLHVSDCITDRKIKDLADILRPSDLLVFNNTKVIPARIYGKKKEASIEVTLHKKINGNTWKAFAKPSKKLKIDDIFSIANDFEAKVIEKGEYGEVTLKFNASGSNFDKLLSKYGTVPLPPYIKRKADSIDINAYQTVYAKEEGAVAAPTAGLHFTKNLLNKLDEKNIEKCFVTLHVGAGTFLPVKTKDTNEHKMHSEYCHIDNVTAIQINNAKNNNRRIIAVGTTSVRTLESLSNSKGRIEKECANTSIFITPGYEFKIVDAMITNFHLPKSTLFMLVSAFAELEKMQKAYQHAIEKKYRFFSYGDCCLLERGDFDKFSSKKSM